MNSGVMVTVPDLPETITQTRARLLAVRTHVPVPGANSGMGSRVTAIRNCFSGKTRRLSNLLMFMGAERYWLKPPQARRAGCEGSFEKPAFRTLTKGVGYVIRARLRGRSEAIPHRP